MMTRNRSVFRMKFNAGSSSRMLAPGSLPSHGLRKNILPELPKHCIFNYTYSFDFAWKVLGKLTSGTELKTNCAQER